MVRGSLTYAPVSVLTGTEPTLHHVISPDAAMADPARALILLRSQGVHHADDAAWWGVGVIAWATRAWTSEAEGSVCAQGSPSHTGSLRAS